MRTPPTKNQARLLIEEWLRCSEGCPRVCAERLRRLASGRASNGWPEGCFLARDVADALLTGSMKVGYNVCICSSRVACLPLQEDTRTR